MFVLNHAPLSIYFKSKQDGSHSFFFYKQQTKKPTSQQKNIQFCQICVLHLSKFAHS